MKIFSADATIFKKNLIFFFALENMLITSPDPFFQYWPDCQTGPEREIPYHQKPLIAGPGYLDWGFCDI
jgi:hypothetical protein